MAKDRKITAVVENHFDQIWRRCFRRDLIWNGYRFISYAQIEKNWIDRNLELAEAMPDYKFQIESPCAVETYVESVPEKKETIKKLYQDGVLKTTNTGYAIVDSNFTHPEAIIRNYLISDAFFREYVGATPKIANRSDAFGNSAQLPQILKNFGAEYVTEIYYNPFDDDVWVGLDKSALCVKTNGYMGGGGGWSKYPPCKTCRGFGKVEGEDCPTCKAAGIDLTADRIWRAPFLFPDKDASGIMRVGGEEFLPVADTPEQIRKIREEQGIDITLGHWDSLLEIFKAEIDQVKKGDFTGLKVRKSPEFNPNNTGGYTSRIKIKQNLCDKENKLLAGETLEAMRLVLGEKADSYDKIWRKFLICAFHDAAYGTIVDQGYAEIMDMFAEIDDVVKNRYLADDASEEVCLFNPTSEAFRGIYESEDGRIAVVDEIAPYAFKTVKFEADAQKDERQISELIVSNEVVLAGKQESVQRADSADIICIENALVKVEADDKGIKRIIDKRHGVACDTVNGMRPFTWIIESDNGSPWARLEPPYRTSTLTETTQFVGMETADRYQKLCFRTEIPMGLVNVVSLKQTINWSVTLFDGYDRVRLDADVNWLASSVRLMAAFPIPIADGRDVYGIPGGWLERKPYEPDYSWNGADGDYSAYRYGGVESDKKSVAVFNRGTPAYKILPTDGGRMLYVTVLRSPTNGVCLHEAEAYTMTEYDGMRDEGQHTFCFEIAAYGTKFANSNVAGDAEQFYRRLLPVDASVQTAELPAIVSGTASITHIKPSEDGESVIVRLTEHEGADGAVTLRLPAWVSGVSIVDMSEKDGQSVPLNDEITVKVRAFEIVTLRVEIKK